MRVYRLLSTAIGGIFMAGISTAAYAGCGFAPAPSCNPGVLTHPSAPDYLAPVGMYANVPYGHLKNFAYKNTPNVNIMRVHSRPSLVKLSDAPYGIKNGCAPSSTSYCRSNSVRVAAPAPYVAPIIVSAPIAPRVTIGSGYNPAAFAPRQYGSADFVPGIAHVPTSIIDRSPITHINGIAQPQPQVRSVTTMAMSAPSRAYSAPAPVRTGGNVLGHVVAGQYTYQPPGGGAYWEKTSGATIVDGLPATQILCRRQAPTPAPVTVRVVRPVIGVPRPVPTPVPVLTQRAPICAGPVNRLAGAPGAMASRYGSRWTY